MSDSSAYTLKKDDSRLVFSTSSYRVDKGSVLHKGIYNHEFASMMASVIICGSVYVVIAFNDEIMVVHYLSLICLFIILFASLRKFVFRERMLELMINRDGETASIITPGLFTDMNESIPLSEIDTVEAGSLSLFPEDRDAAKFVEKISRQHGSVVPGLADEAEFVTLSLKLTDGTGRLIYAQRLFDNEEADLPLNEINSYLKKEVN